jgi:hypothetical protein
MTKLGKEKERRKKREIGFDKTVFSSSRQQDGL